MNMDTVCNTLRQVIRDSGISMKRLEKESGVNRLCIARFLDGKEMYTHNFDALCEYFNLELNARDRKE